MVLILFSLILVTITYYVDVDALITEAESWLGTPYLMGGRTTSGIDCSNYVNVVYIDTGYPYPMCATSCFRQGFEKNLTKIEARDVKRGDVLLFDAATGELSDPGHVGIIYSTTNWETEFKGQYIGSQGSTGVAVADFCDYNLNSECTGFYGRIAGCPCATMGCGTCCPILGYYRYDPDNSYTPSPPQQTCNQELTYPAYSTTNTAWSSLTLGTGTSKFSDDTATSQLVTSVAIGLAETGVYLGGQLATPKTVNTWLTNNDGYFSEDTFIWNSIETGLEYNKNFTWKGKMTSFTAAKQYICNKNYFNILRLKTPTTNFYYVKGYTSDSKYRVWDPINGVEVQLEFANVDYVSVYDRTVALSHKVDPVNPGVNPVGTSGSIGAIFGLVVVGLLLM